MGVARELVGELVGQRQAAHEGQGEGVEQGHEARGPGDVEEQRVVHEPQQPHGGEGAEVRQVLGPVVAEGGDQAAVVDAAHRLPVGDVVLAGAAAEDQVSGAVQGNSIFQIYFIVFSLADLLTL